jgi:hypothetical protein
MVFIVDDGVSTWTSLYEPDGSRVTFTQIGEHRDWEFRIPIAVRSIDMVVEFREKRRVVRSFDCGVRVALVFLLVFFCILLSL